MADIVRKVVPEKVRGMFDGLRLPAAGGQGPERKVAEDPEAALRRARTKALIRHARAVDAIFETQERGGKANPEQVKELQEARKVFEEVRPYGSHDAEAAYKKNPDHASEAAAGRTARSIRALQLETELRTDPQRRADRFVGRWRELGQTSQRQYQAADMSGYKATRSAMGTWRRISNAIRSSSRSSPAASETSASGSNRAADSDWNSPSATASSLAEAGTSDFDPAYFPPPARHAATARKTLLHSDKSLSCLAREQSDKASRSRGSRAPTRPYHPPENRPRPDRPVAVHHLPQDRRGHLPGTDQNQRQRRGLA